MWIPILTHLVTLITCVHPFTLDVPSSVIVTDQFPVKWTWVPGEPNRVVIVLNDVSKVEECDKGASIRREGSLVVLNLKDGAGSIGFDVQHPGSGDTPVNSLITSLANSTRFTAVVLVTTTTITIAPTQTGSPVFQQRKSIAAPVIGSVIGSFMLLSSITGIILFRCFQYRIIRLARSWPSQSQSDGISTPYLYSGAESHLTKARKARMNAVVRPGSNNSTRITGSQRQSAASIDRPPPSYVSVP